MSGAPLPPLDFEGFTLDRARGCLRQGPDEIKLRPKSYDVLRYLVENRGRLLGKEELIRAIWSDCAVTDNSLVQCLIEVRRALRDDDQTMIRTVPRRGYIFEPAVTRPQEPDRTGIVPAARRRVLVAVCLGIGIVVAAGVLAKVLPGRQGTNIHALAVLPLTNLSSDPDQAFFADGMTEALITDLGKIRSLQVTSHWSVERFKGTNLSIPQIAQQLAVDAIVEGTVTRSGDRVRVTANLIQARPEKHLWAETYEGSVQDVLAIQADVAGKIAREVVAQFVPPPSRPASPVNPEAYQEYVLGRHLFERFTGAGVSRGVEHLENAVRIAPQFAPAHAVLSEAYIPLVAWGVVPPKETLAKAEAAARTALSLDDTLAEAHTGMGGVHVMRTEWAEAEREFQTALALNPSYQIGHDWHGYLLEARGDLAAALAEYSTGRQLDPLSEFAHKSLGGVYVLLGRYDDAIREASQALELNPGFGVAHWVLGRAYEAKRMYGDATEEFRKAGATSSLAYDLAISGNQAEARKILHDVEQQAGTNELGHRSLALILVGLGDTRRAVTELEAADRAGAPLEHLNVDRRFDPLRADPRFLALLRSHGFAP